MQYSLYDAFTPGFDSSRSELQLWPKVCLCMFQTPDGVCLAEGNINYQWRRAEKICWCCILLMTTKYSTRLSLLQRMGPKYQTLLVTCRCLYNLVPILSFVFFVPVPLFNLQYAFCSYDSFISNCTVYIISCTSHSYCYQQ